MVEPSSSSIQEIRTVCFVVVVVDDVFFAFAVLVIDSVLCRLEHSGVESSLKQ